MVLLDIEGTTTPVSFVTEVLFPFARERLEDFLTTLPPEERDPLVRSLGTERQVEPPEARAPTWCGATPDEARASALAYLHWLMDRDRKSTTLKSFQGRIWKEGYDSGAVKGALYDDVLPAFKRWTASGRRLAIFSSGSVQAQRLLFAHSTAGDLTGFLSAYFDTTTGPKREADSYRKIARALACPPDDVLFLSDVVAELEAAAEAGLRTALCVRRETEADTPRGSGPPSIRTFDDLE